LRQFNILASIFPATSREVLEIRKKLVRALEDEGSGSEHTRKSMPIKDMAAQVALMGLGEVVTGPAFEHGIGKKRKSDFEGA
jgi:hypothetical protein